MQTIVDSGAEALTPGDVAECPRCGYDFVVRCAGTRCRRCGHAPVRPWRP